MDASANQPIPVTITDRRLINRLMALLDQDPAFMSDLQGVLTQALPKTPSAYQNRYWSAKWQPDTLVLRYQFDLHPQRDYFPHLNQLLETIHGTK
jgi:hypothetical protein